MAYVRAGRRRAFRGDAAIPHSGVADAHGQRRVPVQGRDGHLRRVGGLGTVAGLAPWRVGHRVGHRGGFGLRSGPGAGWAPVAGPGGVPVQGPRFGPRRNADARQGSSCRRVTWRALAGRMRAVSRTSEPCSGAVRIEQPTGLRTGSGQMRADAGRYGQMRADVGKIWADAGRCGQIWAGIGGGRLTTAAPMKPAGPGRLASQTWASAVEVRCSGPVGGAGMRRVSLG